MSLNFSEINDLRQSVEWANYLHLMGWTSMRTSRGINIEMRNSIFGGLVKIQKLKHLLESDLAEIDELAKKHKVGLIKIEPYIEQDIEVLTKFGYEKSDVPMTPTATYLIDLTQSNEELWKNVSHSAKYSINRAKREGARVEIIKNPSDDQLKKFYNILKSTGLKKKFYVTPFKFTYAQAHAFGENGYLALVYDSIDNLCSAKWHVGSNDTVLYVSGGTTPFGRADKSGYLLVWETILYFKKLGFKVFDLEGRSDARFASMTSRWGGFSSFKEKFGGMPVEFPYPHIKYLNPVLKFLHKTISFNL